MQTTNIYGIKSRSMRGALTYDAYDLKDRPKNVFSATELIDSPKVKALQLRHADEIVTDVSDNFHTMDGSAVHYLIEQSNREGEVDRISETRFYVEIGGQWNAWLCPAGRSCLEQGWYDPTKFYVSCKIDNYEHSTFELEDYKRCSVWETVYGLKESRVQQLNIGSLCLQRFGMPVKLLRACLILKDWNARDVKNNSDMPPIPYKEYDMKPWKLDDVKAYVLDRFNVHMEARNEKNDNLIPECTAEERWYKAGTYAIVKDGNKKATKVFEESPEGKAEADKELKGLEKDVKNHYSLVLRPGNDVRCNGDKCYCTVKAWCHYWRGKYMTAMDKETEY